MSSQRHEHRTEGFVAGAVVAVVLLYFADGLTVVGEALAGATTTVVLGLYILVGEDRKQIPWWAYLIMVGLMWVGMLTDLVQWWWSR